MDATTTFTIEEAAEFLGVTKRTIERYLQLGELKKVPVYRVNARGRRVKYTCVGKEDLETLTERRREERFAKVSGGKNDDPVVDAKGLVISNWNRFYKAFNEHLEICGLMPDLNQTLELIALKVSECPSVGVAGQLIGREIRSFLEEIGFNKINGKYVRRERSFGESFWGSIYNSRHTLLWNGIYLQ